MFALNRLTILFSFALLLISFEAIAQQTGGPVNGKITGRIIDSTTGAPVSFASVSLAIQESGKEVNGTTADDNGSFKLTGIANGTYKLSIFFVGYQTRSRSNITISKAQSVAALGDIRLPSSAAKLKAVTISAEKSVIENKIDKMVYNVDKDITSQTGVATDVLRKVPEVSVDVDGNVELQGNSNIRFLIDGKPSTIFGNNITDVLQSIPASQIQSIEIITSPGAKYDAEGTGGIINIILKKSKIQGISGSVSLSGGTRLENGSFNLHARSGNVGGYAYFSGDGQLKSTTSNTSNRLGQDTSGQTTRLIQNGSSNYSRDGYWTGAGFDWEITKKDNLYAGTNYSFSESNSPGSSNRQSIQQDDIGNTISDVSNLLNTANNYHQQSINWYANYVREFKKDGPKLEIMYTSSYSNSYSYYTQTQAYVTPPTVYNSSYGNNPGTQRETDISADYTQPLKNDASLEMGAKATLNNLQNNSDVYLLNLLTNNYDYDTSQSSSLNYSSDIYAGYFSAGFKLFKWLDVRAGFRDEYTETKAYFSNAGNVNIAPYNTYVPSLTLAHTFKGNNTLKLSYSHRIQRPGYGDLDPFINASDPKNVSTGNPNLQPEIGDKIEMNYNKVFESGTDFYLTLFYRGNTHDIQPYTLFYPTYKIGDSTYTNVAVTTRSNIGRENNFGFSIYVSMHMLNKKLTLRPYIQLFQRYIYTGLSTGGNISGFNYRTNLNASYEFTDLLSAEVYGNFNSARINAQGTMPAYFMYTFAIRQQLFHKKGSIAITATNPFSYYMNQTTNLTGPNFTLVSTREIPYQSFGFNFTYRFGKLEFKRDKQEQQPTNTDQSGGN